MKKVQVKPISSKSSSSDFGKVKTLGKTAVEHNFGNFCGCTSLHGWQYIPPLSLSNPLKSSFWLLTVLVAFGASTYFTLENFNEYMNSRTITTLDSSTLPLSDVQFPSFYACNLNQASTRKIENWRVFANLFSAFNLGTFLISNMLSDTNFQTVKPHL